MTKRFFRLVLAAGCLAGLAPAGGALAQEEHATSAQNEANNPLTPKITVNLHDYYIPELAGADGEVNQALLRALVPLKVGGVGQLFRMTLPLVTTPTPEGTVTDLGDLTLIDLVPFRAGKVEVALGPVLVAPTGGEATGSGKWQAGAAGIVIAPEKWGILGSLVTYQHSFAGDDDRADVSLLTMQPLVIYNLPKGWYLRSTGVWTFDLEKKGDYIPLGLGIGKVLPQKSGTTINLFVEPQYTVWNDGIGTPRWQIFAGVNLQFPVGGH